MQPSTTQPTRLQIVEDAKEDKRFRENPLVAGQPGIRFYAGAPLISSANGYRYGTVRGGANAGAGRGRGQQAGRGGMPACVCCRRHLPRLAPPRRAL